MRNSARYAIVFAAGYTVVAIAYIVISSAVAARIAVDVDDMRRIETIKGISYVVVTAIATWLGAWILMRRIERGEESLRTRDRALFTNERRVFAGLMAASVAHDANNVLVGVLAELEGMREPGGMEAARVSRLQASVDRLIALNQRLLSTVRQMRDVELAPMDLANEVREQVATMRSMMPVRGCEIRLEAAEEIPVLAHRALLQPIVGNLLLNAAEAVAGHGTIEVRVRRAEGQAQLEVHDNGPGIPAQRWNSLFEALESTKADGHGLGLFSVRTCSRALGGSVEVGRSPLGGALLTVSLPLAGH